MNIARMEKAIRTRKSRKRFLEEPLHPDHLLQMNQFIAQLKLPFDYNTQIIVQKAQKGLSSHPLSTTNYFAAFMAPDAVIDQAKTGFAGELFVLFAESLGIGTCWYGNFNREFVKKSMNCDPSSPIEYTIYCVTPLGYVAEKTHPIAELVSHAIFSTNKKSVDENLHPNSLRFFPSDIWKALELACLAPSTSNCQCWNFNIQQENGSFCVELAKPASFIHSKWPYPDIDVGTSACHFWLGLLNQNISPEVQLYEKENTAVWKFTIPQASW